MRAPSFPLLFCIQGLAEAGGTSPSGAHALHILSLSFAQAVSCHLPSLLHTCPPAHSQLSCSVTGQPEGFCHLGRAIPFTVVIWECLW